MRVHRTKFFALFLVFSIFLTSFVSVYAAESTENTSESTEAESSVTADAAVLSSTSDSSSNRYNVVILLDASTSISKTGGTDPKGLRYEAIEQFVSLLAVNGNYLGGVVFSSKVDEVAELKEITSEEDKKDIVETLSSVVHEQADETGGYTNIGAGLSEAVEMLLESGDPELPSVVVFLSDGHTDFGKLSNAAELKEESIELESEALELAQENDIQIYTVCLNTSDKNDTDEMKRLASATGGKYEELAEPEDLSEVFQTFYTLIYGSGVYSAADDSIGDDGTLSTVFTVPGIGVEEINIIIDGEVTGYSVANPTGEAVSATLVYPAEGTSTEEDTEDETEGTAGGASLQMIKVESADVSAGDWTLTVEGNPGNSVKVDLIFNTDLSVTASATVEAESDDGYYTGDTLVVSAVLSSDGVAANTEEQYSGYEAKLEIRKADDAYQEPVETVDMEVVGDHFEASYEFVEEGTYNYDVYVEYPAASDNSDPYFERTTELADNAIVVGDVPDYQDPVAIEDTVTKTVYVIPFRTSTVSVDMVSLFEEPTDGITEYNYQIVSSSFLEKDSADAESGDYYLDGKTIVATFMADKINLSKGTFEIQASDWNGDTATVQLVVVPVNVAMITLIIGGIILLIVLIIMGILLKIALSKPFRGDITAQSCVNGVYKGEKRSPRRGRCKLTVFRMDNIGLDYKKCYFQATGDRYIFLVTNKEIIWNNQKTKKVRIQSGAEVVIHPGPGDPRTISIRFDSRVKTGRRSASGRKAPTARPSSASRNSSRRR